MPEKNNENYSSQVKDIEFDNVLSFDLVINSDSVGKRIDSFIAENLDDMSRSRVQKLIADECVFVNGKLLKAKNYKCEENDLISLFLPEPEELDIVAENIPLEIVYEDNDILIVNKEKGMVVHPAPGHYTGTLVNAIMYHCGDKLSGINGVLRPGIVHRIDKDTSGILVICKNDSSHNYVADLLSRHEINRVYYCLVQGIFKDKTGRVERPIGRHPNDRKKMSVNAKISKEAITNYKVIKEYCNKYSLVECRLETGRTHQIRVHMASLNHPLVGDFVYGSEKQNICKNGQMLHAAVLGFTHPTTKQYVEYSSPLPEYFVEICNKLNGGKCEVIDELQSILMGGNNGI